MATVYTHSDVFHPDELLAIALLQASVLAHEPVEVVRTRDPALLAAAQADPLVFVIDVGFVHDPVLRNFDHHQKSMTAHWPDGTPYSACGLVWVWLRAQGALDGWGGSDVLDALEERLIVPADRHDNGLGGHWAEGQFLAGYNRAGSAQAMRAAFDRALQVTREWLDNLRLEVSKDIEAKRRMVRALREPMHAPGLVVIDDMRAHRFPYWAARLSEGEVRLVLTQRNDKRWNVTTTPADLDDAFSVACPAPEPWRGQADVVFSTPHGDARIAFCHKNGYLTVVEGTLEQALGVAQHILDQAAPAHP